MKYYLILFTMLVTVGFFNPLGKLSEQMIKLLFYLCSLGGMAIALTNGVSLKEVKYPRYSYLTVLAMISFSTVMATAFHPQPLLISIMTALPYIFSYSFFFILMRFDIEPKKIIDSYIVLILISGVVYFANVLTFPNNIFGEPIISQDTSRGVIRIYVVFIEMFPLILFYSIERWFKTKQIKWVALMCFCTLLIIFSVIRQIIAVTAILAIIYFCKFITWPKRILLILVTTFILLFVIPNIPMFSAMMDLTERQQEENEDEENIRITAWRYYTYENQTNALTPFFGNGMPSFGNSRWGKIFDSTTQDNGCFAVDVGWAGFFWYYGIFAVVSLAIMMIKAMRKHKPPQKQYLTYWFIFIFVTSFTSGPIVYFYQIFSIMICMYLVFRPDDDELENGDNDCDNENNKKTVSALPTSVAESYTLPRHPQL